MSYAVDMKSYTTVQAAKELGIGRDTLYRWMKAKKIKGSRVFRLGTGAAVQVRLWTEHDLAAIRRWMKGNPYKGRGRKAGRMQ
jgi:excisionase family DNA binding protein